MATSQQQLNFAIRAVNEASATLKKVQQDIDGLGTSSSGATKHTTGLGNSLGSMSKIAGGFVMGAGLLALPGLLKNSVDSASDANETLSKSNTIFGENAAAIEKWASGAAEGFGQSKTQALDAAGTFGNLFVQLGSSSEEAAKMSMQMVELASDFRSFHNPAGGVNEVLIAMQAAFRGEYDAVQRFVPTINAAAVQEKALALGLAATTKELTVQDKALATQALLIEGAGDALGDFDRTAMSAANQQQILSAKLADTNQKFGEVLLPVLVKLLPVVVKVVDAFAKVPGPVLAVGAGLVAVGAAIALVAGPMGAIIGLVGSLAGGVGALAGGAGLLALLGPFGLVVAAIAAAIAIGVLIYKNWDTIKAKAGQLASWLADKFRFIADRAGDLYEWVSTAFGRIVNFIGGIFQSDIAQALGKVAALFLPIGPLRALWNLKDEIASALSGLFGVFERAFGPVIGLLETVGGWIGGLLGKVRELGMAGQARSGGGDWGTPASSPLLGINPDPLVSIADIQERAFGGWVSRMAPYLVGERGPELFVPWSSGVILPNPGHPMRGRDPGPMWGDQAVDVTGVEDRRGPELSEFTWNPAETSADAFRRTNYLASVWESEGFATGGVIPGPPGMPVVIKAHSGETVLPNGTAALVVHHHHWNIGGNLIGTMAELERLIVEALHMAQQRGSLGLA